MSGNGVSFNLSGINSPPLVANVSIPINRYPAACGGEFHYSGRVYIGVLTVIPVNLFRNRMAVLSRQVGILKIMNNVFLAYSECMTGVYLCFTTGRDVTAGIPFVPVLRHQFRVNALSLVYEKIYEIVLVCIILFYSIWREI
jgi:hypothetical protein